MKKSKRYAGILVECENKVLLCKRAAGDGPHDSEWSLPCGKINKGEQPMDAAYREFWEETNVEITKEIELTAMIARMSRNGKKMRGLLYIYLCRTDNEFDVDLENAISGHEHDDWGWFELDELPTPLGIQLKRVVTRLLDNRER